MAILLGKRKRVVAAVPVPTVKPQPPLPAKRRGESDASSDGEAAAARARFQKAFAKKFKPLEVKKERTKHPVLDEESDGEVESEDDDDSMRSGWSGIEDEEEDEEIIEVVQHVLPEFSRGAEIEAGKKQYMSSKPPTLESTIKPTTSKTSSKSTAANNKSDMNDEENSLEATNIKNDLALQRLLTESHLLTPSSSSSSTTPTGSSRLKALDLRLQSLGAKTSVLKQEKMPLAHRKGILEKGARREGERRKEAKENGIVLEREKREKKDVKRERGLGGPGVGRMQGGTLRLSEGDVRSIEGRTGRGGKRGGRGRGGRR